MIICALSDNYFKKLKKVKGLIMKKSVKNK